MASKRDSFGLIMTRPGTSAWTLLLILVLCAPHALGQTTAGAQDNKNALKRPEIRWMAQLKLAQGILAGPPAPPKFEPFVFC